MNQITRARAAGEARIARVGFDLAERVIQVHAFVGAGAACAAVRKRDRFLAWCARSPAAGVIATEISSGAHPWALRLRGLALRERSGRQVAAERAHRVGADDQGRVLRPARHQRAAHCRSHGRLKQRSPPRADDR